LLIPQDQLETLGEELMWHCVFHLEKEKYFFLFIEKEINFTWFTNYFVIHMVFTDH
jgi:hypothetical protein